MNEDKQYDVIIIGGSYAGLAAAMTLGRSLRNTLVIDSGKPCNQPTPHAHNFLTQDGKTPKEISTLARHQVAQYKTVTFFDGFATGGRKTKNGFEIETQAGNIFRGKTLVLATGIKDHIPDIDGFKACWGKSLIHCPYCHGYENRGKWTGIIANGEKAMHLTPLIHNLTKDITILTMGEPDFTQDQINMLKQYNVAVVDTKIAALEHEEGALNAVVFTDGSKLSFEAIYGAFPFSQHSEIASVLGCELTEMGYIKVDNLNRTSVEGVFACGDNSSFMRSIANAVSSGNFTGAVINKVLTEN